MLYDVLIKLKKFSDARIKQLFDEARLLVDWYSAILRGRIIRDQRTLEIITRNEVEKRYARIKGILWALGYPPEKPTKEAHRELYRRAFKDIHDWHLLLAKKISRLDTKVKRYYH